MHNSTHLASLSLILLLLCTCSVDADSSLDPQELRLPTGAAMTPNGRWLFVMNSNLDEAHSGSTVMSINLDTVEDALEAEPLPPSSETTAQRPCRRGAIHGDDSRETVECDERWFIDPTTTVEFPSGGINIGVDFPAGEKGPMRLLLLSKIEAAITWVDVDFLGEDLEVSCGQKPRRCSDDHVVNTLERSGNKFAGDPSRLYIPGGKDSASQFGIIPHLLGSAITLVRLRGSPGPRLVDVGSDFYRANEAGFAGGFAAAERPCALELAPAQTMGCTLPLLYTTHRFWRGLRSFTISPGKAQLDDDPKLYPPANTSLTGLLPDDEDTRPILADLKFADSTGDRLLVVQTSPPSLVVVDTSVDARTGRAVNRTLHIVPVCANPNILEVFHPAIGRSIALVSCYSEDQIAVVDLQDLSARFIDVDDGPNELVIDHERKKLYVVHTIGDTIGAIELDNTSPDYLQFVYRIGLASP